MTVYTIALSKGGSTKTTTAAELVAALTRKGRRVLAIDLDHQGTLSQRLGIDDDSEVDALAAEVLTGTEDAHAATPAPSVPGAHVLPGTYELNTLETRPEVVTSLRDHLPQVAGEVWDDVVIDTPPAQGVVTLAALAAADVVIAAVACEAEAYDQVPRLQELIAVRVAPRLRPGQQVHWIIPTRYDERRVLDRDVLENLTADNPGRVTTPVRETVVVRESYLAQEPVSIYAPTSPVAGDYAAALAPIITTATNPTNQTNETDETDETKETSR